MTFWAANSEDNRYLGRWMICIILLAVVEVGLAAFASFQLVTWLLR